MRKAQTAWLVSFVALLGYLAVLHLGAADVMPMRFGFDGEPVGWADRENYFLFAYSFVFVINLIFGLSCTRQAYRLIPIRLWNIPYKEYWLAPERREEGLDRIGDLMAWGGLGTNLTMGLVYAAVQGQATGSVSGDTVNAVVVVVVVASIACLPAAWAFMRPPTGN